jgi:hypothetical protein
MSSSAGKLDRTKIANNWKGRGFSCGLWVDPPGQVWEDYVHSTDELLMLTEGALETTHTSHTVRNIGGTTAKWLYGYQS